MKHYAVSGGLLRTADDNGGHHYHSDDNNPTVISARRRICLGEEAVAVDRSCIGSGSSKQS